MKLFFFSLPPLTKRVSKLLQITLVLLLPLLSNSQPKPASIAINPGSLLINGSTFTAKSMLAPGLLKALGKPETIDTLHASQLKSLNDFTMATLNKYTSNGLMLMQGKNSERVNRMTIYLNPVPSKKYIDYVNSAYKGKLTVLGFKIDSNTTIRQLQKAMSKYDFSLSEEYKTADVTIFDPKTGAQLLELWFYYLTPSEKIESVRISVFPAAAVKKQVIEYRGGQLYMNDLLLDTSANRITQLKKILGRPNAVFDIRYRGSNGYTYNARRHLYTDIAGISLIENPFNQSLLAFQMDFLNLRSKNDLNNPLFDLVINKKTFHPDNAVPGGPGGMKSHYVLDSVLKTGVASDDKTYVTSWSKYGNLEFEFAGDNNWTKRVYTVTYHLNTVRSQAEIDRDPVSKPELFIKDGQVWMQTNKSKVYWNGNAPATDVFREIIGDPASTTANGVSVYPAFGVRMWAKDNKLSSIQFYLAPYINAYSGNNDAPGVYTGHIKVEGINLTTGSTVDQVKQALSVYNLQKAYDDKNHTVYKGSYSGVELYLTYLLANKKLISVSVYRK